MTDKSSLDILREFHQRTVDAQKNIDHLTDAAKANKDASEGIVKALEILATHQLDLEKTMLKCESLIFRIVELLYRESQEGRLRNRAKDLMDEIAQGGADE